MNFCQITHSTCGGRHSIYIAVTESDNHCWDLKDTWEDIPAQETNYEGGKKNCELIEYAIRLNSKRENHHLLMSYSENPLDVLHVKFDGGYMELIMGSRFTMAHP